MDRLTAARTQLRASVTRLANQAKKMLSAGDMTVADIDEKLQPLTRKEAALNANQEQIKDAVAPEALAEELAGHEMYEERLVHISTLLRHARQELATTGGPASTDNAQTGVRPAQPSHTPLRKVALPKLQNGLRGRTDYEELRNVVSNRQQNDGADEPNVQRPLENLAVDELKAKMAGDGTSFLNPSFSEEPRTSGSDMYLDSLISSLRDEEGWRSNDTQQSSGTTACCAKLLGDPDVFLKDCTHLKSPDRKRDDSESHTVPCGKEEEAPGGMNIEKGQIIPTVGSEVPENTLQSSAAIIYDSPWWSYGQDDTSVTKRRQVDGHEPEKQSASYPWSFLDFEEVPKQEESSTDPGFGFFRHGWMDTWVLPERIRSRRNSIDAVRHGLQHVLH